MAERAIKISAALISVSDKTGVAALAKALAKEEVLILSSGGTAAHLREAGVDCVEVSDYTGQPEILDGRVKTLHPRIHGGILADKGDPRHLAALKEHDIRAIDLVVVNFYPFARAAAEGVDSVADYIDIGGPAMARAAAKNYRHTVALSDPADYDAFIAEWRAGGGAIAAETSARYARKIFALTAAFDGAIANYLHRKADGDFPSEWFLHWRKLADLNYGENPHQRAALFADVTCGEAGDAFSQIQGASLSYNNILDAQAAWRCVREFSKPCCAIIKHGNPCGLACGESDADAYIRALAADRAAAFGGVVGFNRELSGDAAARLTEVFAEAVVAPQYCADAKTALAGRERLRAVLAPASAEIDTVEYRKRGATALAQTPDCAAIDPSRLICPTARRPDADALRDLLFAWKVAKQVKSNAIVLAKDEATVGVGAGQMSRVDAATLAIAKAGRAGLETKGAVAASDGFFPFADAVSALAEAGVGAVIQPGGSRRDEEIVKAADERGMAMLFTGVRHFFH